MRKTGGHGHAFVVKLRGLPYAVTEQQIEEFFTGKFIYLLCACVCLFQVTCN